MLFSRVIAAAGIAAAILLPSLPARAVEPGVVEKTVVVLNGITADRYTWLDSRGKPRSVSLKQQGNGNTGNGGYAIQFTYQYLNGETWTNHVINPPATGEGFGYFVSHEAYHDFADGRNGPIAQTIFSKDDSPLGRGFPVTGVSLPTSKPSIAAHHFTLFYPRYGTINPYPYVNGNAPVLPTATSAYKLYQLKVGIRWIFQAGTDFPRIRTAVSMADVGGPDRVSFDVRGPYGVMNFDGNLNGAITKVAWSDRYHFQSISSPLTRNSTWNWLVANTGARYHTLVASGFEMGLLEPRPYANTALRHGFAFARNKTSTTYNGGAGCADFTQKLPCDWEWPYQSAQYSLPYDNNNQATTGKKIAWGSSANYGYGPSLTEVWDTQSSSQPFVGYPASATIGYDVCLVLGRTVNGTLAKTIAAAGGSYRCATGTI